LGNKEDPVLDHVSVGVTNIERSRRFYDAALRPLGLVRIVDFGKDRGSDYGDAPSSLGLADRQVDCHYATEEVAPSRGLLAA
jgi:catechol 2,3-dioxygenase-like lactoylglutathione lyase family enzyme